MSEREEVTVDQLRNTGFELLKTLGNLGRVDTVEKNSQHVLFHERLDPTEPLAAGDIRFLGEMTVHEAAGESYFSVSINDAGYGVSVVANIAKGMIEALQIKQTTVETHPEKAMHLVDLINAGKETLHEITNHADTPPKLMPTLSLATWMLNDTIYSNQQSDGTLPLDFFRPRTNKNPLLIKSTKGCVEQANAQGGLALLRDRLQLHHRQEIAEVDIDDTMLLELSRRSFDGPAGPQRPTYHELLPELKVGITYDGLEWIEVEIAAEHDYRTPEIRVTTSENSLASYYDQEEDLIRFGKAEMYTKMRKLLRSLKL